MVVLLENNSVEEIDVSESGRGLTTETWERLKSAGHRTPMRALSFSQDGASILSGSQESLKLWNRDSLLCLRTLECLDVLSVLFVPGDRHCLAGTKVKALYKELGIL